MICLSLLTEDTGSHFVNSAGMCYFPQISQINRTSFRSDGLLLHVGVARETQASVTSLYFEGVTEDFFCDLDVMKSLTS